MRLTSWVLNNFLEVGMKVIINRSHSPIGFSDEVLAEYARRTGREFYDNTRSDWRTDVVMCSLVEEYGDRANGKYEWGGFADLKVVEIPDDVKWVINNYDGVEWVSEVHRTWR